MSIYITKITYIIPIYKAVKHSKNTHTSCVYFDIKFSGLSPIYPKSYFKIIKVVLKKLATIDVTIGITNGDILHETWYESWN